MTECEKDDRSSHQLCMIVPNFNGNRIALIFRHLTPKKSRKMFIIEYITVLETLRKREAKQTQIKGKHPD